MTGADDGDDAAPAGVWSVRDDVAVSRDEGRAVVLPLGPPEAIPLELTGAGLEIWLLVDGERDLEQIVTEVARLFDTDPAQVGGGVERFLARLEEAQVLERRSL